MIICFFWSPNMLTQMIFVDLSSFGDLRRIHWRKENLGLSELMLSGHVGPVATQQNSDIDIIDMLLAQNRLHPKYPNAMVHGLSMFIIMFHWNGNFSGVPQFQTTWCVASGHGFFYRRGCWVASGCRLSHKAERAGFLWSSRKTYPKMKHWTPKKARINDDKTSYPAQLNNIPPCYFLCCIFTSPLVKLPFIPFIDENGYPSTIAMAKKHRNCRFQSLENTISLDGKC